MARGNRGQGFPSGSQEQPRGRGGRGRGRGGRRGWRGGRGGGIGYDNDLDFVLQFRDEQNDSPPHIPQFYRGRGGYNRGFGGGTGFHKTPNSQSRPITPITPNTATPTRGRGRDVDTFTPGRGRGTDTSASGQRRKRGFNKNAPLSKLLYEDRPYLRPIIFVRSTQTPRLFEAEEEIFETMNEDESGDGDDVPTADKVFRVFNHDEAKDTEEGGAREEIEEIDFQDMGKVREEVERIAAIMKDIKVEERTVVAQEELFTGVRTETKGSETGGVVLCEPCDAAVEAESCHVQEKAADDMETAGTSEGELPTPEEVAVTFFSDAAPGKAEEAPVVYEAIAVDDVPLGEKAALESPRTSADPEEAQLGFYIDTGPAIEKTATAEEAVAYDTVATAAPLGNKIDDDDDEVIVFVAPEQMEASETPRASTSTLPAPTPDEHRPPSPSSLPPPSFSSVSFSFPGTPSQTPQRRYAKRPKSLLANRPSRNGKRGNLAGGRSVFGSFGAAREEREMWGQIDPRHAERRMDDDVSWGDESEEESEAAEDGGMEVDADVDINVMRRFVQNMGPKSEHLGMGDLEDLERMRVEDEESNESSDKDTDKEEELIFNKEERVLIAEEGNQYGGRDEHEDNDEEDGNEDRNGDKDEDEDGDDDNSDVEDSPRSGFQARLERLRNASKGKGVADDPMSILETVSDDDVPVDYMTWSDDDKLVTAVQEFIDGNEDILNGRRNRKERNQMFRAIQDGASDELQRFASAKRNKDKGKDLPPELQEQWQRDRAKKAEYKRQRETARLEAAADPLARKKGGKKGRKAMRAVAGLDPSIEISNRVIDMVSLEVQIRRFIADIGDTQTMTLPPCDKETRKAIHELAIAFNLSSKSKGSGADRYITLAKTTKTGVYVKEKEVARMMRRFKSDYGQTGDTWGTPGRKRVPVSLPKHKEGDEVGKAAPKIDNTNIGFKMLANMGWSDGDRIGLSGGLTAPLAAVFKKTKLGLGATM